MLKHIDFTKIPVALEMNSGTIHYPTNFPKESWPEDGVIIHQQWTPLMYAVEEMGDYLSIKTYNAVDAKENFWQNSHACCLMEKYSSYKAAVDQYPDGYFLVPAAYRRNWGRGALDNNVVWYSGNSGCEFRIYKDDKIAVVYTAEFPDGSTVQYMTHKLKEYTTSLNEALPTAAEKDNGKPRMDLVAAKYEGLMIVQNDEQIAQEAVKLTYKATASLMLLIPRSTQDLRRKYIGYANSYSDWAMADETAEAVSEFLRCSDPTNADRRAAWTKKCGSVTRPKTLGEVLLWIATPTKKRDAVATKENMAQDYLDSIPEIRALWDDPNPAKDNTVYWARSTDAIVAIGIYPRHYYNAKLLFAFDLRRKVRFYGEFNTRKDVWTFPVPSAKMLADSFASYYTNTILGGLTSTQLFAGTNAGWLLEHSKDVEIPDPFYEYNHNTSTQQTLVSLQSVITSHQHSHWAMTALATSGQALFEQLLKSGLVKLYSAALDATADGTLQNLFRKPDNSYSGWRAAAWSYDCKGKNLPQMLGAPMLLIREAEALTSYQLPSSQYYVSYHSSTYELSTPKVQPLLKAMPTLGAADAATRQFWLQRGLQLRTYGLDDIIVVQEIQEKLGETSPARLAQLLEKYGTDLRWLPDYRKAQELLQKIQQDHPELPGLYNSRLYPKMPNKAIRFIHFVPGMKIRSYSWEPIKALTPDLFLEHQKNLYPNATITPVYDALSNLLGAQIVMTPGNNLRYLHDDANYWVNFYGQAEKHADFQKAVRRVAGLAWTDPKLGLTIRAPQSVEELNQEGGVLMHSVASFADAIIAGSTNVMFIRRVDMPDMPYFTLELCPNGAIRQVHCFQNGGTSEEEQTKAFAASGLACYQSFRDILRFLINWGRAFPHNIDLLTLKREYQSYLA